MARKSTGSAKMTILVCMLLFATIGIGFLLINVYTKANVPIQKNSDQSMPAAVVTTYQTNPHGKNNGNNVVATNYAKQLSAITEKTKPGLLSNIYVDLEPSNVNISDQNAYKNSVTLAKLTLQVNKNVWETLGVEEKRNLITTFMGTLRFSTNTAEGFIITDTKGNTIATGHE